MGPVTTKLASHRELLLVGTFLVSLLGSAILTSSPTGREIRPVVATGWTTHAAVETSTKQQEDASSESVAAGLEAHLRQYSSEQLTEMVNTRGNPARGALVYYNPESTCVRCHEPDEGGTRLGPSIAEVNNRVSIEFLIESLLDPSAQQSEGFQSETFLTSEGKQLTGIVITEDPTDEGFITIANPDQNGESTRIAKSEVDERAANRVSAMPRGLVGALPDEQSFLDLVSYLMEIKVGGLESSNRLRPPKSYFAQSPLPEYESRIDHRKLIEDLDENSLERGAAIFQRYCARCHGTRDQEGSMPTALKFAEGIFKNGSDPESMYETLTHGYGLMVAQRWMVPKQKYDVIHYIRESFLKDQNANQYYSVDDAYLTQLPTGDEIGPEPVETTPWSDMNYGDYLFNTLEVGQSGNNIAYKGIAVRLDAGPGGVTQGKHWILYEHDTMRVAAAWSGSGFIDYNGIHLNDRHNIHPRIVGDIHAANDHQPGWANPDSMSFNNDPRIIGRDGKRYGPLPRNWLKYKGLYKHGNRSILRYTVGDTEVLESPSITPSSAASTTPVFQRTLRIEPHTNPMLVKVASVGKLAQIPTGDSGSTAFIVAEQQEAQTKFSFNGRSYLESSTVFDWNQPLSIVARIKTTDDGTIICQTSNTTEWVPGGTSLFVRNGRLVFDIGWVGDVTSRSKVNDGQWHQVALVWQPKKELAQLFIDGKLDREGELNRNKKYQDPILRIGFTAKDFPENSMYSGAISNLVVINKPLNADAIGKFEFANENNHVVSGWNPGESADATVPNTRSDSGSARWVTSAKGTTKRNGVWAAVRGIDLPQWRVVDGSLCLQIPPNDDFLDVAIAFASTTSKETALQSTRNHLQSGSPDDSQILDLQQLIHGGPDQYPTFWKLKSKRCPRPSEVPFWLTI